ncbi:MAG: hypothetical protein IMF15_08065 [Proteobacteria bacterium]|nr:hypothetical protein [Pseudomonadota bacterium]
MKTIGKSLMLSAILSFGLSGCLNQITIPEQMTNYNVGCEKKDMKITNDVLELNGERHWNVECGGKKYYCDYLEESSSNCYEIHE